eukprot:scaffold18261_cov141-Skeletonema_marinoi.AAC.9
MKSSVTPGLFDTNSYAEDTCYLFPSSPFHFSLSRGVSIEEDMLSVGTITIDRGGESTVRWRSWLAKQSIQRISNNEYNQRRVQYRSGP